MPYIKKEARTRFQKGLEELPIPDNAGELNYLITMICIRYFKLKPDGRNYQTINDVSGVLHCAADEFTRRIAGAYEDSKIRDNGDVYN